MAPQSNALPIERDQSRPLLEVFTTFLTLGLTSFGGPIAHLAYLRKEFIERRNWIRGSSTRTCLRSVSSCRTRRADLPPGFLLVAGVAPLWQTILGRPTAARAIAGINAVVGILGQRSTTRFGRAR